MVGREPFSVSQASARLRPHALLVHGGFGLSFGPEGGPRYGALQSWDGNGWRVVHGAGVGPGVRDHHAMVWDPARGELLLFGGHRGEPGDDELLGDTWIRRDGRWSLFEGAGPPARATHRMVWDPVREVAVLFGGFGDDGFLGDTWTWDGEGWTLVSEEGPSARFAARLAWDGYRGAPARSGGGPILKTGHLRAMASRTE